MTNGNPRVRKSVTVIGHSPDVVEFRTGIWNMRSYTVTDDSGSGKMFALVSALDGTASLQEVAERHEVDVTDVEAVTGHLAELGVLGDGPVSALDAYLDDMPALGRTEPSRQASKVLLLGDPVLTGSVRDALGDGHDLPVLRPGEDDPLVRRLRTVDPAVLHDGLRLRMLAEEFEQWRGAFAVVTASVIDPQRLQVFNRLAARLGIAFIHGALDGPYLFAGPTVLPGRSACYECFESRVAMNLREKSSYVAYKAALARGAVRHGNPPAATPVAALLASHLALETVNYLHTGTAFTLDKVLGVHVPTMEIAYHEVLRLPGCAGCGTVAERDDSPLYFDPRTWLDV
ncbi:TOMM precursor leader peptide-binding protein [Streptomyces montanisoli]|uniref:TOMM leader peptide-binding protein n=1 Tax=Streptomyces montanisoli TaxID=2798581 RepID=A0A940RWH0_9ACTN|nr:TOMM precursor leader peptide-binding protein [Streptomyces montanisoli]MBP0456594.1 TOMM precursor leader peptide-binding protein [Streptomyces montanisoli]